MPWLPIPPACGLKAALLKMVGVDEREFVGLKDAESFEDCVVRQSSKSWMRPHSLLGQMTRLAGPVIEKYLCEAMRIAGTPLACGTVTSGIVD